MRRLFIVAGFAATAVGLFGSLSSQESAPEVTTGTVAAPVTSVQPTELPTVVPVPVAPEPAQEPSRTPVAVPVLPAVPSSSVPAPVDYVVPVDCPQEDTCRMDYRGDGTWVLIYGETYTPEKVWSTGPLPVTCPQEDDCGLDYRGDLHRWVITENAPH